MDANKVRIKKELKDKLGLRVDIPQPGSGNSNDGNTARKFFDKKNSATIAEVTGKSFLLNSILKK